MQDFSIFEDHHIRAAEARLETQFEELAAKGSLLSARFTHDSLLAVRAELERRAIAGLRKSEAA